MTLRLANGRFDGIGAELRALFFLPALPILADMVRKACWLNKIGCLNDILYPNDILSEHNP